MRRTPFSALIFRCVALCLTIAVSMSAFADGLDDAIAELDKKIEAERRRYEGECAELKSREESLQKEVARLESDLTSLREKAEALSKEQREMKEKERSLKKQVDELKAALSSVEERIKASAATLKAVLSLSIPPASIEKVQQILEGIASGKTTVGEDSLKALFSAYKMYFESAGTVNFFDGELVCGDGRLRKVSFITLGSLGRIYFSEDGGWCGIVLQSADSPLGWEYVHNPKRSSDGIKRAFEEAERESEFVRVPVDPTGRVSAQGEMETESFWEHLKRGGPVMVPIGIVALIALVIIITKFFSLTQRLVVAPPTETIIDGLKKEGKDAIALRLSRSHSVTERIFAAILRRHPATNETLEEVLVDSLAVERVRLERFIGALGICVTVAPLLGLLGTVTGMIRTFETITAYGAGDPRYLAGGIREALITTEAGLIVAIPVLLLHSFLTGKIERLLLESEHRAGELITALEAIPR